MRVPSWCGAALVCGALGGAAAFGAPEWIRGASDADGLSWGIRGGLVWGIPVGVRPVGGPRGLIRLRYPTLPEGKLDLINFIAVEPIVKGVRGFSELERSRLDDARGLRLWAEDPPGPGGESSGKDLRGRLFREAGGGESLAVLVRVEKFANGAHVTLAVTHRNDAPGEIELAVRAESDSAPLQYCVLTATMGNKARARLLWLKGEVASSLKLYPEYKDDGFAPHVVVGLDRLARTAAGDVIAAVTTDETDPAAVTPFPGRAHWRYAGFPVTQYWRKPAGARRDDLHVAVNGRFMYWMSRRPIPGGIAFENFEMRERFHAGQRFVFGITRKTPSELGIAAPPPR